MVLGAMGWISGTVVRLDRLEVEARHQAALEEKVRLSLWRMDTALAPLISQESARPYFAYKSFLPIDRAYANMFNAGRQGSEPVTPSPLLSAHLPQILLHFQFEPDGSLTSPQIPSGSNASIAVPKFVGNDAVKSAADQIEEIKKITNRDKLLALLPKQPDLNLQIIGSNNSLLEQTPTERQANRVQRENLKQTRGEGFVEYQQRGQVIMSNTSAMAQNQIMQPAPEPNNDKQQSTDLSLPKTLQATDISGVLMTPLWIDGQLILARRVNAGGREYVQGCLLDWPAVKTSLLESIADLLPTADLVPSNNSNDAESSRLLAALPARLIPGNLPQNRDGSLSPIILSLIVAWTCVSMAAVAVAGLLWGVVRLSERRATFVSAVTHELRTPLTTFQMYTEMLTEDMVSDEVKRREYLNTMHAESIRLTHLVENVLSFARLERGRVDRRVELFTIDELLHIFTGRLVGRAEQAGMELDVKLADDAGNKQITTNAAAVEQILFNLVDNACKYASTAEIKTIELDCHAESGMAVFSVRDHGPGLTEDAIRRLFQPFSKSAQEAAHSAPGVGLGLALSRRLARDLGGDLTYVDRNACGACFTLKLSLSDHHS